MTALLHRSCPICQSTDCKIEVRSRLAAENLGAGDHRRFWAGISKEKAFFSYARCEGCGLLYSPAYFTDAQLQELYSDLAPNMEEETGSDAITATQRGYFNEAVGSGLPLSGGYLEIGPDVGHVTRIAAETGSFDKFWLYEPNVAVHDALAKATLGKPASISTKMTNLSAIPDESIGLAVMVHVLDHLLEPAAIMAQIYRKLQPNGAVLIVTHNEKSMLRDILGVRWPPFCMQHPEIYNPQSISRLLERGGYHQIKVRRSKNFFPLNFLIAQAGNAVGLNLERLPLPRFALGLRLGNILTVAHKGNASRGLSA